MGLGQLVSVLTSVDISATQYTDVTISKLLFLYILLIILNNFVFFVMFSTKQKKKTHIAEMLHIVS